MLKNKYYIWVCPECKQQLEIEEKFGAECWDHRPENRISMWDGIVKGVEIEVVPVDEIRPE